MRKSTHQPVAHVGCLHGYDLSRRGFIGGVAAVAIGTTAGCLGDDEDESPPEPIGLTEGQTCEVCGMEIAAHHGPAVQAFYEDSPIDGDGPAAFDSVHEFVSFDVEQRTRGNDRVAAFATDYASVEYDLIEQNDSTYISTHVGAEDFAPVEDLHYVVESTVLGAMGEDAYPFSNEDEALELVETYGGSVVEWTTIAEMFD